MSKLCKRARNWIQVCHVDGEVRQCSWTRDGKLGSLIDSSFQNYIMGKLPEKYENVC